jgi:hypothetical protein
MGDDFAEDPRSAPGRPRMHIADLRPSGTARSQTAWRIDRRNFLKLAGASAAGLLVASPALAQVPASSAPSASDAIFDLALELGFDMERAFQFVSEQVRYEPYSGVLRGARGTLMGGAGNSADKAVLLAALLETSQIPYRFAMGSLIGEQAAALLASASVTVDEARQQTVDALAGTVPGGRPFPAVEPDPETRAWIEEARARADTAVEWAKEQVSTTIATITTALETAGVDLTTGPAALPVMERDQHLWVQALFGTDWIDLDPSLPGHAIGDALATATRTVDSIPDELRHVLRFRVIGETLTDGVLTEEALLDEMEFADVLAGQPIGLVNVEREGLKALGAGIVGGLEGGTTYLPCLMLGEVVAVGPGALPFRGAPGNDPFGSQGGSAAGGPTAEWLEITITSPGADQVVVRRPVFDRVGLAMRASGPLDPSSLEPVSLVQLEPDTPPDYLPAQTTHWLTVHTGIIGGEELHTRLQGSQGMAAFHAVVHGYNVFREAAFATLALPEGDRLFLDAPNIVSLTIEQEYEDGSGLSVRPGLDIWHRSYGTLPVAGVAPAPSAPMTGGVLAHVAERLLFGDPLRDPTDERTAASVGAVFDAARRDGIPVLAGRGPDDLDRLAFAADAKARLAEQLAAGLVAIVPERPVRLHGSERVGWWLIDPRTGRVSDQLDDGRGGGGMPGRVVIHVRTVEAAPSLLRLGTCVAAGAIIAVTGAFAGIAAVGGLAGDLPYILGGGIPTGGGALVACLAGGF